MFVQMTKVRVIENIRHGDSNCQSEHKLRNEPDWIHRSALKYRGNYPMVLVAMKTKGHHTMPLLRCHLCSLVLREGMRQSVLEDSHDCAETKAGMHSFR